MKLNALRLSLIALVATSITTGPAFAEAPSDAYTHPESGLEFKIPGRWKVETEGDLMTATHPSGELAVVLFVASEEDAETFFSEIAGELDRFIKNVQFTRDPTEERVNNLTQVYVEGTGTVDGESIDFDLTYVLGGRKPMVAVAIGKIDANQKAVTDIYRSIKKAE